MACSARLGQHELRARGRLGMRHLASSSRLLRGTGIRIELMDMASGLFGLFNNLPLLSLDLLGIGQQLRRTLRLSARHVATRVDYALLSCSGKWQFDDAEVRAGQLGTGGLTRAAGSSQCRCENGKTWWSSKWPGDGDGGAELRRASACCCWRLNAARRLAMGRSPAALHHPDCGWRLRTSRPMIGPLTMRLFSQPCSAALIQGFRTFRLAWSCHVAGFVPYKHILSAGLSRAGIDQSSALPHPPAPGSSAKR